MVFGIVLAQVALKLMPINELLGKSIALNLNHEPELLGWMLGFSLILGLISGIYPALYLSSILPLSALVGSIKAGKGSIRLKGNTGADPVHDIRLCNCLYPAYGPANAICLQ